MPEIFSTHKFSTTEIRRLLLICHALDLSSNHLHDGSSMIELSPINMDILHEQISSNLLLLAIGLRVNFYKDELKEIASLDVISGAGMYWDDELRVVSTTVKDVCDKIVHADVFSKDVFNKHYFDNSYPCIHIKGKHNRRNWTLDLCVAIFCELILDKLDEASNV